MKKKRFILFLVSIALFIAIALIIITLLENLPSLRASKKDHCERVLQGDLPSDQNEIIWVKDSHVVSFDRMKASLSYYISSSDLTSGYSQKEVAKVSLLCPANSPPTYHCLQEKSLAAADVLFFNPPYGLIEAHFPARNKSPRLIIPFWWDGKEQHQLATPLHFCPKTQSPDFLHALKIGASLFIPDKKTSTIYRFDMDSMTGFAQQTATRPAQAIYYIDSSGNMTTIDCPQVKSDPREFTLIGNGNSFAIWMGQLSPEILLASNSDRDLKSYQWLSNTLSPDRSFSLPTTITISSDRAQKFERFSENEIISLNRGKWFSSLIPTLYTNEKKENIAGFDRLWMSQDQDKSFIQKIHKTAFTVISQPQGSQGQWAVYSCQQ